METNVDSNVKEVKEETDKDKYEQLRNAVCDLLAELRIDEKCLEVMANGYSPDYPGGVDLKMDESWQNPFCKIQLSRIVASKLISTI